MNEHPSMNERPPAGRMGRVAPVVLGLLLAASGCAKAKGAGAGAPERPPAPVTVSTAVERSVAVYLEEIGRSTAREVVTIQPQVPGPITRIHFTDGADVKRGDLLFTIDPRPYQAALDAAEASLEQNRAALALAKIEFARVEKLIAKAAISRQEYDARSNAVAVTQAQVKASQAAIATARLNLEHCYIRSPIDGRAGQRQVDLGNLVTAGGAASGTPLLVIQRLDPIYADFTVPEKELASVQRSMAGAALRVEVRLPEDAEAGARAGDLTFLDNAVQNGTGTVRLRATLANPDRRFWPGRFVKVRLVLGEQKGAVLVPATATQVSAKGPFVYVVKPDATAELRPVSLGQRQGELVALAGGVKPGEQVVTAGQLAVTPGGKVRVQPSSPATTQADVPRDATAGSVP
jgi:multidrug efflux system membrane fusion protein